jgi:hypothetical protein
MTETRSDPEHHESGLPRRDQPRAAVERYVAITRDVNDPKNTMPFQSFQMRQTRRRSMPKIHRSGSSY